MLKNVHGFCISSEGNRKSWWPYDMIKCLIATKNGELSNVCCFLFHVAWHVQLAMSLKNWLSVLSDVSKCNRVQTLGISFKYAFWNSDNFRFEFAEKFAHTCWQTTLSDLFSKNDSRCDRLVFDFLWVRSLTDSEKMFAFRFPVINFWSFYADKNRKNCSL